MVGKERLCKRHVETGVAESWEEAIWRAENNDIPSKLASIYYGPIKCN